MPNSKLKILIIAVFYFITCNGVFAQNAALDAMWYSSSGGTTSGSNGTGIYGPSFVLKVPNKTYQIAYFDPPRYIAGCSGMSMSLGGFGMLSNSQFKTMVRNIMQAAPSYLMELAISSMCTSCATVMQHLHDLATKVNSLELNSCKTAEAIVNAATGAAGLEDLGPSNPSYHAESMASASNGSFASLWGSLDSLFSSGPTANRGAYQYLTTGYGNTVVNVFENTGAINKLDTTMFGGEEMTLEIIQSLIGTQVLKTTGQQSIAQNSDGSAQSIPDKTFAAALDFDDLVNGAGGAAGIGNKTYYQCQSSGSGFSSGDPLSCQDIALVPYTFGGIKNYLLTKFSGNPGTDVNGNPTNSLVLANVDPNSLVGKFRAGTAFNVNDQVLLGSLPVNLQRIFSMLQTTDPATAEVLYDEAFQVFSETLAATATMSIIAATNAAYSATLPNIKIVPMSISQKKNLDKLQSEAKKILNSKNVLERLEQLTRHILSSRAIAG